MFGFHPGTEPAGLDLSEIHLTPDADAVLTEITRVILDIFESVPRRTLAQDWSNWRPAPWRVPDDLIPSAERVKPHDTEIAMQAHAKRTRLDPRSNPRYRRQFKQRFSSH